MGKASLLRYGVCISVVFALGCNGDDTSSILDAHVDIDASDATVDARDSNTNDGTVDANLDAGDASASYELCNTPELLSLGTELDRRQRNVSVDRSLDTKFHIAWANNELIRKSDLDSTGAATKIIIEADDVVAHSRLSLDGGHALFVGEKEFGERNLFFRDMTKALSSRVSSGEDDVTFPQLVKTDAGYLAFARFGSNSIQAITLDTAGTPTVSPIEVVITSQIPLSLSAIQIGSKIGLAWVEPLEELETDPFAEPMTYPGGVVKLMILDQLGATVSPATTINQENLASGAVELAADEMATYVVFEALVNGHPQIRLRRLDLDGKPAYPQQILTPGAMRGHGVRVLNYQGGLLVAFRESQLGPKGFDEPGNIRGVFVNGSTGELVGYATLGNYLDGSAGGIDVGVTDDGKILATWQDYEASQNTIVGSRVLCDVAWLRCGVGSL